MNDKPIKQPGPDHPITIEPNPARVVVTVAGQTIADTRSALTLREAAYAPVQYIPLADVDQSLLLASEHASYCPFKGDAELLQRSRRWRLARTTRCGSIESPTQAVGEIRDHLAFYPDRVDSIVEEAPAPA